MELLELIFTCIFLPAWGFSMFNKPHSSLAKHMVFNLHFTDEGTESLNISMSKISTHTSARMSHLNSGLNIQLPLNMPS